MPILHVDLREGFSDDTVVVRVAGREVYRRSGVRTNYSVGLADRMEIEVPEGELELEVTVPERGAACRITHSAGAPATLAFALDPAGTLTGRKLDASPRYL